MEEEWIEEVFDAGASAAISKTVHPVTLGTLLRETVRSNVVHRPAGPRSLPRSSAR